jgi:hypothetical protein
MRMKLDLESQITNPIQSQFQTPTLAQGYEKEGARNECRFLEPYIGDRTAYWGIGSFSKAISPGGEMPPDEAKW